MGLNKRLIGAGATASGALTPSENFKAVTWSGDGNDNRAIEVGFKPDMVWYKTRNQSNDHNLSDSTRGAAKQVRPNRDIAEVSATDQIKSFTATGFTVGTGGDANASGNTYVAWCWKANGGTTSSNSDGSITSTVQANTDAGFSIIQYNGTGAAATIGHGLGVAPDIIFSKRTSSSADWVVGVSDWTKYLELNGTPAFRTASSVWNNTAPTSTVFSVAGSGGSNGNGETNIAYAFKSIDGFSKIGSYTGNGSTNGPIVETGFEPAFVMIKNTTSADNWAIYDNKRNTVNSRTKILLANSSAAEATEVGAVIDFLSNGFQSVGTGGGGGSGQVNKNANTYIYMAFAADPDTEAPTLASSFSTNVFTDNTSNDSLSVDVGFKAGLIWTKYRGGSQQFYMYDNVRSKYDYLSSNTNSDAQTRTFGIEPTENGFTKFGNVWNRSGANQIVAWTWKADDNEPTIFGGPAKAVYKFEDNANDVGGNYNGSVVDTVTYVTGNFNKAANFTASASNKNEIVTTLTEGPSVGISLSCWVKFSTLPSGGADSTFVIKYSASEYIHLRYEDHLSKGFSMQTKNSSSNVGAKSEITASTGVWYHVVGTVNSGGTGKIYVNGELKATNTGLPLPGVGSVAWRIGGFDTAQSTRGDYAIDQVRIYYDEIKQEQVDELYAETVSDNDDLTLGAPPKSTVSANANAGFSIVKYTGTYPTHQKIPHGLSAAPNMILIKNLADSADWEVYHSATGNTGNLVLNSSAAFASNSGFMANTSPTATVFTVGNDGYVNGAGDGHIAYCFHDVTGYQKFGSYSGTGSEQLITTGFAVDFVLIKASSTTQSWMIYDSVRSGKNYIEANSSAAEGTAGSNLVSFESNGFKVYTSNSENQNGQTYIYWAIKIN